MNGALNPATTRQIQPMARSRVRLLERGHGKRSDNLRTIPRENFERLPGAEKIAHGAPPLRGVDFCVNREASVSRDYGALGKPCAGAVKFLLPVIRLIAIELPPRNPALVFLQGLRVGQFPEWIGHCSSKEAMKRVTSYCNLKVRSTSITA